LNNKGVFKMKARLPQGMGKGPSNNMNQMLKQAQKMQKQMETQQAELEAKEFSAAAGGGVVEVTVTGKREVTKVKIDPEAVDPDDVEMLEDLIATCINNALKQVDDAQAASLGKYNIPGLM
jgi:DNA-binding YbaB/EbfC family protein